MLNAFLIDKDNSALLSLESNLRNICPYVRISGKVDDICKADQYLNPSETDLLFINADIAFQKGHDQIERNNLDNFLIIFTADDKKHLIKEVVEDIINEGNFHDAFRKL
jgi:hypothetical protein